MKYLTASKFKSLDDINQEISEVKNLHHKYERLCLSLLSWKKGIEQVCSELNFKEIKN